MRKEQQEALVRVLKLMALIIEIVEAVTAATPEKRAETLAVQSIVLSRSLRAIYTSGKQLRDDQDVLAMWVLDEHLKEA